MNLIFASALLLLAAAAPAGVTVQTPWIRYLLPSIPAGGYLTLQNAGDVPEVLTGASSPACGMLMLHESADSSGMAMMESVPSVTIPPHGSVSFVPGGYHLMCMQPKMKAGEKVDMTLEFRDGTSLNFPMPVYGPGGAP